MSKEEQKPNIYQIPKNSFDTGNVLLAFCNVVK